MNQRISMRGLFLATVISCTAILPGLARATIVEVQTNVGDFQVNLYDTGTPQTVANYLSYVTNFAYTNSIVHRSVPGFVIQGGGFDNTFGSIPANAPVVNEPVFASVRGTIAMAKPGDNPNGTTNQWFVNLDDNTTILDGQNGGFTVFGEVVSGMDIVDAIAALPRFNLGSPFNEIPLQGDPGNAPIDDTFLVVVTAVIVIDPNVDSAGAAGLNPPANTAPAPTVPPPVMQPAGGGGGGSFGIPSLLLFVSLCLRRRILRPR